MSEWWPMQATALELKRERDGAPVRAQRYFEYGALRSAERAFRYSRACDMELRRRVRLAEAAPS